jgi:hypothetical protein
MAEGTGLMFRMHQTRVFETKREQKREKEKKQAQHARRGAT